MLCVATMGINRAWRESANVRSSPVGSVSPTVANAWYSSQTKSRSRQIRCGCAVICGMRWSTARWKSSFWRALKLLTEVLLRRLPTRDHRLQEDRVLILNERRIHVVLTSDDEDALAGVTVRVRMLQDVEQIAASP